MSTGPRRLGAIIVVMLLALMASRAGAAGRLDCDFDLASVRSAPRFADYLAAPGRPGRPTAPVLASRRARSFRTTIHNQAADGPNFAGHYTVVVWGCGSSCTSAAIVDAATGRVMFPDAINDISGVHVAAVEPPGRPEAAYNSLRFQLDSRLLVVVGAPNEDERRDGVAYFVWTGFRLRLLRFVSREALCPAPG